MQMLKKVLSLFSNPSLLVSCVSRNNKYASFVALIKRTKGINSCLCVAFFFLKRGTPIYFFPLCKNTWLSFLCPSLQGNKSFQDWKMFYFCSLYLVMSFVFCQLLRSVLLILSEQSHDGSRSFLSGNKEFGTHSCICMVEVVFLCCIYKHSRVLFLPTLSLRNAFWSSCSVSQDLFAVLWYNLSFLHSGFLKWFFSFVRWLPFFQTA